MSAEDSHEIRTLADIEAFEQTPWEERTSAESTYELLCEAERQYGDEPALGFLANAMPEEEPSIWSYRELLTRIRQAANLFTAHGIDGQGVVSLLLPNLPQFHFALWGAQAVGIGNPVNPLLEPRTIAGILREAGTRILVTLGPAPGSDIWQKAETLAREVESLQLILAIGAGDALPQTLDGVPVLDFDRELTLQPGDALVSTRRATRSDIAAYFHTGGTTGTPKLAIHTHGNEVFMAVAAGNALGVGPGDVTFGGLPLFHVNAVFTAGLQTFARGACAMILTPAGFRHPNVIPNFWKLVEKHRATSFSAVPTVYTALLQVPVGEADISSLRFGICGAAPSTPEMFRQVREKMGIEIIEGYGLTEGTCASALNPAQGEKRVGSIGLRLPYQELKCVILDENGDYVRDCETDEVGVIIIRGPNVFAGYTREEANRGIFLDGGWLVTGDLARQDADGYLWLTGRSKDLIIRGGHNIDPSIIEETLSEHADVALTAAVGQPDSYAGELPCAFVTLRPGARTSVEELLAFARERIPERAAVPVHLEILQEMPVTAVGKIFKPILRDAATRRVLSAALADAGIEASVVVAQDSRVGALATVRTEDEAAATEILDQYAVSYRFAGHVEP